MISINHQIHLNTYYGTIQQMCQKVLTNNFKMSQLFRFIPNVSNIHTTRLRPLNLKHINLTKL